jgi:hypothetical protein
MATNVTEYRQKGLIKPVGYGLSRTGIGPFYRRSQIRELKRKIAKRRRKKK